MNYLVLNSILKAAYLVVSAAVVFCVLICARYPFVWKFSVDRDAWLVYAAISFSGDSVIVGLENLHDACKFGRKARRI